MRAPRLPIGLVPMAGRATRLGPLHCSKELLPVGGQPVSRYLLEAFRAAGLRRAVLVLRPGKWDIPDHYGAGDAVGLDLAYALMRHPFGVPYTLDSAYAFIAGETVAFGFPDIVFEPADAVLKLWTAYRRSDPDLLLGLFPSAWPTRSDVVRVDARGRLQAIEIKPEVSDLTLSWALALWSPRFSDLFHDHLAGLKSPETLPEVQLAPLFLQALEQGLRVETLAFPAGGYWDIGTPEGYTLAQERFGG